MRWASAAPPISRPEEPVPAWLVDAALGTTVTLAVCAPIASQVGGEAPPPVYLWAVGLGAVMLARRWYPRLVLLVSVVGFFAYYAIGYPPIGVAVPVAAAVLSAAQAGRLLAAALACFVVLAGSTTYRLLVGQDPRFVLGYDLVGHLLLLVAAVALGDSLRARRSLQEQAEQIASLTADRARRETEQRAAQARMQTARDLHDSLGHSLAIISLHTSVSQEALRDDPEQAGESLGIVAATTRIALQELRQTVTGLRTRGQPHRFGHSLDDLDSALEVVRRAGFSISTSFDVTEPVPPDVQDAVYRIVQESATNTVRHSNGDRLRVELTDHGSALVVRVADNGTRSSAEPPVVLGHGLQGMQERAEALGGRLDVRRTPDGFETRVELPRGGA